MSQSQLSVDVYVTPMRRFNGAPTQGPGDEPTWSPMSSTLIAGAEEGILVDTLLTNDQVDELAQWVRGFGKHITGVYITHGHSDHWMGLARLQKHFPEARGMATPDVVERATFEATNPGLSAYWQNSFRGELPAKPILPEALSREEFELAPRRPRQPAHPLALGAHRNGKSELTQPRPWPMTAYLRR